MFLIANLIIFIYLEIIFATAKDVNSSATNLCYQLSFINTTWTDRRPEFIVNMSFTENSVITAISTVNEEIKLPISSMVLMQKDHGTEVVTLFNTTTKLCDLVKLIKKVPILNSVSQNLKKQSNYSFDCPMRVGVYAIENLRINSWKSFLGFLYRPKRVLIFRGGLYSELENKSLIPLTTYVLSAKVLKKRCVQ